MNFLNRLDNLVHSAGISATRDHVHASGAGFPVRLNVMSRVFPGYDALMDSALSFAVMDEDWA